MREGFSAHAVFCDDIRPEIDGKATLVGVHMEGIRVNGAAPAGLPQLWLALWITYPVSPRPETVRIVAKADIWDVATVDISLHPRQDAQESGDAQVDEAATKGEFIAHRWAPVYFTGDGAVTVEIFIDGRLMWGANIPVRVAPQMQPRIPPALAMRA